MEPVINKTFGDRNYFYTSLGNSLEADRETWESLKELIKKRHIRDIQLVLSHDNQIIMDALEGHYFSDIRGLQHLYEEIAGQKKHSRVSWPSADSQFIVMSYYLNKKIKQLQWELTNPSLHPIEIKGKIYHRQQERFTKIHSALVCLEKHYLN